MANPMEMMKSAWENPKGPGQGFRDVGKVAKKVGKGLYDTGITVGKEAKNIAKEAPGMIKKAAEGVKGNIKKTVKMMDPNASKENRARFKGYSDAFLKKKGEQIEKDL